VIPGMHLHSDLITIKISAEVLLFLANRSWVWNANVNYGINLSPNIILNLLTFPFWVSYLLYLRITVKQKYILLLRILQLQLLQEGTGTPALSRPQIVGGQLTDPNEIVSRDFQTTRGFNFNWKLTEGGFLNLSTNYNVNISSSLANIETDYLGNEKSESQIWREIFTRAFSEPISGISRVWISEQIQNCHHYGT
jgi:hypothetical protein